LLDIETFLLKNETPKNATDFSVQLSILDS